MYRTEPLTEDDFKLFDPEAFKIIDKHFYISCEPKKCSFGWYRGRVVTVDYH